MYDSGVEDSPWLSKGSQSVLYSYWWVWGIFVFRGAFGIRETKEGRTHTTANVSFFFLVCCCCALLTCYPKYGCFMSKESPSNTLVGSHGMGCNRSMWKLSFNCQLCPCSWSQHALQRCGCNGLLSNSPTGCWTPHFHRNASPVLQKFCTILYRVCFVWHSFKCCSLPLLFFPLYCLLAFILLFVSSTVLFIYLHSLCALSQGCEQHLSAGNSLCYHVIVKRAPIQSQGSIFLKGKPCYPQLHVCTAQRTNSVPFGTPLSPTVYDKVWIKEERNYDKGAS